MTDYQQVNDQLKAGVAPDVLCATCPWDRLCITPPSMTKQEVDRRIAEAESRDSERGKGGMPMQMLMTAMVLGGRDQMGTLCPVFALRLRGPDGRQVADAIRTQMRGVD